MNEPMDPFELLRELNPIEPGDLRAATSSPQTQEALEQILAGDRHPRRRRLPTLQLPRFRRRVYILALVPLAAGLAAAAWALSQGATKQLTVGCYASVSLQAHTIVVAAGNDPITTCRDVWSRGDFGTPTAPRLQACLLPSGAIGVFPSPDGRACEQLKLTPLTPEPAPPSPQPTSPPPPSPQPSPPPQPASPADLKDALVREFLANRCLNAEQATAVVQDELRALRLTSWRVQTTAAFTNSRRCASLAFDEERHLVLLVPMPKTR
jgi:hypothetical protein